jgi:hypothetical protein
MTAATAKAHARLEDAAFFFGLSALSNFSQASSSEPGSCYLKVALGICEVSGFQLRPKAVPALSDDVNAFVHRKTSISSLRRRLHPIWLRFYGTGSRLLAL